MSGRLSGDREVLRSAIWARAWTWAYWRLGGAGSRIGDGKSLQAGVVVARYQGGTRGRVVDVGAALGGPRGAAIGDLGGFERHGAEAAMAYLATDGMPGAYY